MATYRITGDDDRDLTLAVDNHLPRVWIHEPAESGPVRHPVLHLLLQLAQRVGLGK